MRLLENEKLYTCGLHLWLTFYFYWICCKKCIAASARGRGRSSTGGGKKSCKGSSSPLFSRAPWAMLCSLQLPWEAWGRQNTRRKAKQETATTSPTCKRACENWKTGSSRGKPAQNCSVLRLWILSGLQALRWKGNNTLLSAEVWERGPASSPLCLGCSGQMEASCSALLLLPHSCDRQDGRAAEQAGVGRCAQTLCSVSVSKCSKVPEQEFGLANLPFEHQDRYRTKRLIFRSNKICWRIIEFQSF